MNTSISQVSEIQIKYQPKIKRLDMPKMQSSFSAYRECLKFLDSDVMNIKEEAVVLFLKSGRLLGGYKISSGGVTTLNFFKESSILFKISIQSN
jgi:DNA repair protein RadC